MNSDFLLYKPERFLCPFCGQWHRWENDRELGFYHATRATLKCPKVSMQSNTYYVFVEDDYLCFSIEVLCREGKSEINGKILVSSIYENPVQPIVTCQLSEYPRHIICESCNSRFTCPHMHLVDCKNPIYLGFEFNKNDYVEIKALEKCDLISEEHHLESVKMNTRSIGHGNYEIP